MIFHFFRFRALLPNSIKNPSLLHSVNFNGALNCRFLPLSHPVFGVHTPPGLDSTRVVAQQRAKGGHFHMLAKCKIPLGAGGRSGNYRCSILLLPTKENGEKKPLIPGPILESPCPRKSDEAKREKLKKTRNGRPKFILLFPHFLSLPPAYLSWQCLK